MSETDTSKSFEPLEDWIKTLQPMVPEYLIRIGKRLLCSDFDRRVELLTRRYHENRIDPFGFDFGFSIYVLIIAGLIYRYYFRVTIHGIENVPDGKCMLVANHSGQIPIDGAMIATALILDASEPRLARSMFEKWAATIPFVNTLFTRCGQVVGRPENLKKLLDLNELILVFPEGSRGIVKPYSKAYNLSEFGLGFMRLALEKQCPIVPVAVVGAEEQYPSVANLETIARILRMPSLPLPIQCFIPVIGILPLPSKYRIYFGQPLRFTGNPDDEDNTIRKKVWTVKHQIQLLLHRGLKERKHIFW